MSDAPFAKVTAKTAAEVCKRYEPEEPVVDLLTDQQTPAEFLDLLITNKLPADACRFLAQALPKREAIWWAFQCAQQAAPPKKKLEQSAAALQLVEKWLLKPEEPNRRPAQELSEAAGIGTPAGSAALAVFFSGGSMTPPDLAPVPPPEHLAGVSVANAVILASVLGETAKTEERYAKFLALGKEVAAGTSRWKEPPPAAKRPR